MEVIICISVDLHEFVLIRWFSLSIAYVNKFASLH